MRTLDMLYSRPDRARHIRSLKVNPDSVITGRASRWGRSALPDGYAVSSAVRRAAKNFEVLRCFAWGGEELPPYDDMWFALRILCVYHDRSRVQDNHPDFFFLAGGFVFSCPHLKFISTTLGSILPSPNSHVRGVPPPHPNSPSL